MSRAADQSIFMDDRNRLLAVALDVVAGIHD